MPPPRSICASIERYRRWQREALQRQLAPMTLAASMMRSWTQSIERYRALGEFKRVDDLQFARLTTMLSLLAETLLSYHGNVQFQHGNARFHRDAGRSR